MSYQQEIKAIKLLQQKASDTDKVQQEVSVGLEEIRAKLNDCGAQEGFSEAEKVLFEQRKAAHLSAMCVTKDLSHHEIDDIYKEAELAFPNIVGITDILDTKELQACTDKYNLYLQDFNKRYGLDGWDYAIACSCGLFAGMLDMFFVSKPPKPTTKYTEQVDGVFNRWVQDAFNKLIPPELSEALGNANKIGTADASTAASLLTDIKKPLSPMNHRLRSLAHDPVLGFIFGVIDMMRGTCTIVNDGRITSIPGTARPTEGNVFQLLGRMFGHLLSDVNAPSDNGNRGMGLPAPFMGILRMFECIKVPKTIGSSETSTLGKQIEWMYINGYDFRQFIVTSIPMAIMEVMLRVFYTIKQMNVYDAKLGETLLDTMPLKLNPRFRIMLALAYGTSASINAGKVYVTKDILNANYACWMGFAWNSFHALRWSLWSKHMKFWDGVIGSEVQYLNDTVSKIEKLSNRAATLPHK